MNNIKGTAVKYGSLGLSLLISVYEIVNNPEKFSNFENFFTSKRWLGHLGLLTLFSLGVFYYHPKHSHERESTKL